MEVAKCGKDCGKIDMECLTTCGGKLSGCAQQGGTDVEHSSNEQQGP